MFERFYRVDSARSPSHEGAGLGLSPVKWIVDCHAGTIAIASSPGRGSTVTVRLPIAPPDRTFSRSERASASFAR
jgi:signal transduction histidine kinase